MLNIPAVAKSDQLFSAMEPARGGRREFRSMWLTFHIDERNKNGIPFTDWHSTCITRIPPMHTCMTIHAVLHQLSNAQNSSRIYKFISRSQSFMCPTFGVRGRSAAEIKMKFIEIWIFKFSKMLFRATKKASVHMTTMKGNRKARRNMSLHHRKFKAGIERKIKSPRLRHQNGANLPFEMAFLQFFKCLRLWPSSAARKRAWIRRNEGN